MRVKAVVFAISIIAWLAVAFPLRAEQRHALLIGNEGYTEAVGPLENPPNDIALIKRALMSVGFLEENIRVVLEADRVTILEEVDRFAARLARAGDDAISFFYYSGHGAANERRENYLIPVDVPELTTSGFWYRSVSLRRIIEQLSDAAPDARQFVVFDACRNTLKLREPGTRSLIQPKGFVVEGNIPGGMLIAFATAEGELASDVGDRAGPYASVLAEELVRPGVEAVTAFRRTQVRVRQKIQQEPWVQFNALGEVYFAGRAAPDDAAQAWAAVQDTQSEAVLETFIARFPDSVYASFARARLQQLDSSPKSEVQLVWKLIKTSNDVSVIKSFKQEFGSDHPHYNQLAEQLIKELEKENESDTSPVDSNDEEQTELYIRPIQRELKRLGCYNGAVDGIWGPMSRSALNNAMRIQKLELQTPLLSSSNLEKLRGLNEKICQYVTKNQTPSSSNKKSSTSTRSTRTRQVTGANAGTESTNSPCYARAQRYCSNPDNSNAIGYMACMTQAKKGCRER